MSIENHGWGHAASPFHAGERALQERAGVAENMDRFARRVVRDHLPDQHREFYNQLPFVVVGHGDCDGNLWATMLAGPQGFATSATPRTLTLQTRPVTGDPLTENLKPGLDLGFLGIELHTRRRNRMSGHVTAADDGRIDIAVDQAFGNCPQYIQARTPVFTRDPAVVTNLPDPEVFRTLDVEAIQMIRAADTLFVASAATETAGGDDARTTGVDVSHRGGRPGFVLVDGDTLTVPDYAGNFHFNTMGNFLVNPRAGLLFVDFGNGDMVQLTGRAEILWDGEEVRHFEGAERAWRFHLERGVRLRGALPLSFEEPEFSPNSLITGTWQESEARAAADVARNRFLPHRVTRVEAESRSIRSLYLQPEEGGPLPEFLPGQFLTLNLPDDDGRDRKRTYTVSSAPSDGTYRISVKREAAGEISRHLHDRVETGDSVLVLAPRGEFHLDITENRPAVLLAGGVGITPMIAMARQAAFGGLKHRHVRSLTVIHAARETADRAFFQEFRQLEQATGGTIRYISVISQPGEDERPGQDFHGQGRISRDMLRQILPLDDYDFYLCGPGGFMQAMYDLLISLGVADHRIMAEAFGPSALQRQAPEFSAIEAEPVAEEALVVFASNGAELRWTAADGTLLDLAEAHGFTPPVSCRSGRCGSCATRMTAGTVVTDPTAVAETAENEILLCSARPAEGSARITLDL